MAYTLVLVDDHPVFRKGLLLLLSKEKDLKVIGEAGDGLEAIELVRLKKPDIVVMDISMPNMDGIEATRQILSEAPDTRIVALSVQSGKQFVRGMIQAGAKGYILKERIPEEMINGIRTVLANEVYLDTSISNILISDYKELLPESGAEPDQKAPSILYTKLHRPPIPVHMVPRTRLIQLLEDHVSNPLTLIAAPAGYGKSLLASQWLEVSDLPGAWISLDDADNDLRVFLSYIMAAIEKNYPRLELQAKTLLDANTLPPSKAISNYLLNDLEPLSERFILILDDYHNIKKNEIHDLITELLVHPTPSMHLVLLTRRDPPLPLTNLRARGMLIEVAMEQLCFNVPETKSFLERFLHTEVTDQTAQVIAGKMEGWITGLQLAAVSIRNSGDPDRLIDGMLKTTKYMRDYLIQEVLSHVAAPFRRHLLKASLFNRFSASLCQNLSRSEADQNQTEEDISGQAFIDWLLKSHIFTIPLDSSNQWFRFHHLFKELLQGQLTQNFSIEEINALHSLASRWFAENNLVEEAIWHALSACDLATAVQIVAHNRQTMLNADKWYVFEKWLSMFSHHDVNQHAELLMTKAWLLYHHFDIFNIPPLLDAAEKLLQDTSDDQAIKGEIDFFRGYILYFQNNSTLSLKHLNAAKKRVPESHHEIHGHIEVFHGLVSQMQGNDASAITALNKLLKEPQWARGVGRTRLLVTVVYIHIISGNLAQAESANQELYHFSLKGKYDYARSWSLYLKGLIAFYRNDLEIAIDGFEKAIEQKYIMHIRAGIDSMAGIALAYQSLGKSDAAETAMKHLREFTSSINDPAVSLLADTCQARLSIMQKKPIPVYNFLKSESSLIESMVWWLEIPALSYCRAKLAEATPACLQEAFDFLTEILQLNQDNHNTLHMIHSLTLLAVTYQKLDRTDEALETLDRAINLATPGRIIFPFLELGDSMAALLALIKTKPDTDDFIATLLTACGGDIKPIEPKHLSDLSDADIRLSRQPGPQDLVEPLTNRELDIVELLARRLQNKEIAERLFISNETVKGHLKNIYQKIGATNRREAVEIAKSLGILG